MLQTSHNASWFTLPGYPSQAGSKPGDVCRGQAPISLWPLGAAGVQIPLPAPFYQCGLFLSLIYLKSTYRSSLKPQPRKKEAKMHAEKETLQNWKIKSPDRLRQTNFLFFCRFTKVWRGNTDKEDRTSNSNGRVIKIKTKAKNKPKDQKKINQTKNKGKKEWKQR